MAKDHGPQSKDHEQYEAPRWQGAARIAHADRPTAARRPGNSPACDRPVEQLDSDHRAGPRKAELIGAIGQW